MSNKQVFTDLDTDKVMLLVDGVENFEIQCNMRIH